MLCIFHLFSPQINLLPRNEKKKKKKKELKETAPLQEYISTDFFFLIFYEYISIKFTLQYNLSTNTDKLFPTRNNGKQNNA